MPPWRWKELSNDLTQKITENPDLPLIEVLLHPDLAVCVDSESVVLIEYLLSPPGPEARIVTLTQWALSDDWKEPAGSFPGLRTTRLQQPSRNAASVLSSPNRRLFKRLMEERDGESVGAAVFWELFNFVAGQIPSKFANDPVYVGHFERILETLLREAPDFIPEGRCGEFYFRLLHKALENVDVLAYQRLLYVLAVDFPWVLQKHYGEESEDDAIHSHVLAILREAMQNVTVVERWSRSADERLVVGRDVFRGEMQLREQKENVRRGFALNLAQKSREPPQTMIQCPVMSLCARHLLYVSTREYRGRLRARLAMFGVWERCSVSHSIFWDQKAQEAREAQEAEEAQVRAYLLLGTIQSMLRENPTILNILQRLPELPGIWDPHNGPDWKLSALEYLLAIGVYSDKDSMVSPLAFRLIRLIAHGYEADKLPLREVQLDDVSEPPIETHPCYGELAYKQLVESYAPDIKFEFPLTTQMMAAFATFCQHRYPGFSVGTAYWDRAFDAVKYADIKVDILTPDGSPSGEKWHWKRPRSRTPLDVCAHVLFYEPAYRDFFNRQILVVLNQYNEECNRIRNDPSIHFDDAESYAKHQRAVLERDIVFFECVRTKAIRRGERLIDMTALLTALPIHPLDRFLVDTMRAQVRAPLNGAIVEFAHLWLESSFFTDQLGTTELAAIVNYHIACEAEDCDLVRSMGSHQDVFSGITCALKDRQSIFDNERSCLGGRSRESIFETDFTDVPEAGLYGSIGCLPSYRSSVRDSNSSAVSAGPRRAIGRIPSSEVRCRQTLKCFKAGEDHVVTPFVRRPH